MAVFDLSIGRDYDAGFNWEAAAFDAGGLLTAGQAFAANQTSGVTDLSISGTYNGGGMYDGLTVELHFIGTGLTTNGTGHIDGGIVTDISLVIINDDDNPTAFHLHDFAPLTYAAINALLDGGAETGRDATFLNVFASEATTFNAPAHGAATFFGSSAADTFNLGGDPDDGYLFNYVWTGGGDDQVNGTEFDDFADFGNPALTQGITVQYAGDGSGDVTNNIGDFDLGHFDDEVNFIGGTDFDDIFNGDEADNQIFAGGGDDLVDGGDGNDYVEAGHSGTVTMMGGGDTINGGGGDGDKLSYAHIDDGGDVVDVVFNLEGGGSGSTELYDGMTNLHEGAQFTDIENLQGGAGDDTFNGDDDDNRFEGYGGDDTFNGADGFDTVDYGNEFGSHSNNAHGVLVNFSSEQIITAGTTEIDGYGLSVGQQTALSALLGSTTIYGGQAFDTFGKVDSFDNIEHVQGTQAADTMVGGDNEDHFEGSDGDDVLYGAGNDDELRGDWGNDQLFGGDGNDEMKGSQGNDTMDGGHGWDRINYNLETPYTTDPSGDHGIVANLSDRSLTQLINDGDVKSDGLNLIDGGTVVTSTIGDHTVRDAISVDNGGPGFDRVYNVEELQATHYKDYIVGSDNDEDLNANGDNDVLYGLGGQDTLTGGTGDDSVYGGDGDDNIRGGSGTDFVDGGDGYDQLAFHENWGADPDGLEFALGPNGGGTVDGEHFHDQENDHDDYGDPLPMDGSDVHTTFKDIERLTGTSGNDTFTIASDFSVGSNGNGGPDNTRYVELVGGAGSDTFTDNTTPNHDNHTSGGAIRLDYGSEQNFHDNGLDHGVLINLSDTGEPLHADDGFWRNVGPYSAIDTFGDTDNFSHDGVGGSSDVRAFSLTYADDVIIGGTAWINVFAGDGNDKITGSTQAVLKDVNGDDLQGDDLNGGEGDDTILGLGGNDYIKGGQGNDSLDAGASNAGWATLVYQNDDWEGGPSGVDVIWDAGTGTSGVARDNWGNQDHFVNFDAVKGSDQRDLFVGNNGDQYVKGGFGIDIFSDSSQADHDTYSYDNENDRWRDLHDGDNAAHGAIVDLEYFKDSSGIYGKGVDYGGDTDLFINIENIDGGQLADNITGSSLANFLQGGNGNDTLNGDAGNDTLRGNNDDDLLIGGAGNDSLNGGNGNDILRGGSGKDTLDGGGDGYDVADFSDQTKKVEVTLNNSGNATAKVNGKAEDTLISIHNLTGGSAGDKLVGNTDGNWIQGGGGKDTLDGGGGIDTVFYADKTKAVVLTLNGSSTVTVTVGGAKEDSIKNFENAVGGSAGDKLTGNSAANYLNGNGGNDTLSGGSGNDTLHGGLGKDSMTGGANSDTFYFGSTADSLGSSASNRDFIADFVHGTDKIDFSSIDGDTDTDGFQGLIFNGTMMTNPTEVVGTGHIGWYKVDVAGTANDRTFIYVNTDTDNANEMVIELKGAMSLDGGDFNIV